MTQNFWSMATTLPNLLTYGRIIAIPFFVGCLCFGGDVGRWSALAIFIGASLTDFWDGYLARAWQQTSLLGQMLDPIADKLLVSCALIALVADDTISGWSVIAVLLIISREIFISGMREFLGKFSFTVSVSWIAKIKTTIQMLALIFLIAGPAGDKFFGWTSFSGIALLWLSAILTVYTGYDYFHKSLSYIANDETINKS